MRKKLKRKKKKDVYALATNILKLQRYNFEKWGCEGIILFEWFVIKGKSFGYKEFYQSLRNIREETGIKRAKAEKIISKFKEIGLLQCEIKGMPKVRHFIVDFSFLAKVTKLSLFYKKEHVHEALIWFKELEKQAKKKKQNKTKGKDQKGLDRNLESLIIRLNHTFNSRREVCNEENKKEAIKKETSRYNHLSKTEIPISLLNQHQLSLMLDHYKVDTIENSFIAYADNVFKGNEEPYNMMNHFLMFDESKGTWSVFDYYLNHFNTNYSMKNIM